MEGTRFDRWTRRLGQLLNRRRLAALLTTSGLGAVLPLASQSLARKKKHKNKGKNRHKKKCKHGAIKCGKRCVNPHSNAQHCGDCETACGPGETCQSGQCTPGAAGCGSGGNCLVFATSTLYTGKLGGLTGADQKCNDRAQAAGLAGVYKAWLSDNTGSPSTRFVQSAGPYVLAGGLEIAGDWADLTNSEDVPNHRLTHEINRDEFGSEITVNDQSRFTWTNTLPDGTPNDDGRHCQNWSTNEGTPNFGNAGNVNMTDSFWTYATSIYCNNPGLRLYCFQQS